MVEIMSRAEGNLPPVPDSIGHRSLSSWTGIKVHHTGGAFSSWRAIHDWQTEGRPDDQELAYIGYSFGISGGNVWTLRGWDHHPAHDHENSTLGVVFGGSFTSRLPSEQDLAAFVWFCRLAREKTGKQLPISGHRDTWPRGDRRYSTCPGDRLYAHLPELRARVEEDDMPSAEEVAKATVKELLATRVISRVTGNEVPLGQTVLGGGYEQAWRGRELAAANQATLAELEGRLAGLTALVQQLAAAPPSPVTAEQLAAMVAAVEIAARSGAVDALERVQFVVEEGE